MRASRPTSALSLLGAALIGTAGLVGGLAHPASGLAQGDIPQFQWGQAPSGLVAFAAAEVYDDDGNTVAHGGIVATPRGCDRLDCLVRMTSNDLDGDPAWSPTGRQLAFTREFMTDYGPSRNVVVLDTETGQESVVENPVEGDSPHPEYPRKAYLPTWSPDGQTILFGLDGDLATIGVSAPEARVTASSEEGAPPIDCVSRENPLSIGRYPTGWSLDGSTIYYARQEKLLSVFGAGGWTAGVQLAQASLPCIGGSGRFRLFEGPSDAPAAAERPVTFPGITSAFGAPSPDSRSFAIASGPQVDVYSDVELPGPFGLWVAPLQGGTPVQLQDFGFHYVPSWTPEGDYVELGGVLYKADGSGPTYVTHHASEGGDSEPRPERPASVQCRPGSCLTLVRIEKRAETLSGGPIPATFRYRAIGGARETGGSLTYVNDPLSPPPVLSLPVPSGEIRIEEEITPGWRLASITCDRAGPVDVAARSVTLTVPEASTTTCVFTSEPGEVELPSLEPTPSASPERCDTDSDGDGFCDALEEAYRSDPDDRVSYPVTPPGYWDTRDRTVVPEVRCEAPSFSIDACQLLPGDVILWRYTKGANSKIERFFGDTYYSHSLLVVGFLDLGRGSIELMVADITPLNDQSNRTELALTRFVDTVQPADDASPEAVWAFRADGLGRPAREAAARRALELVWDLGASLPENQRGFYWRAPVASYSLGKAGQPSAWGPSSFYCSSYIATSYGLSYLDMLEVPRLRHLVAAGVIGTFVDAHFATPDDLLDALPGMSRVAGFGPDGRGWSLWSPANLLITDPEGLRTGRDADGTVYEEIPGALWTLNEDNESVSAPGVTDDWTVIVSGTGSGTYHLVMHAVGEPPGPVGGVEATTAPGKVEVLRVGDIPIVPAGASGPSGPPGASDFAGTALLPALGLVVLLALGAIGGLLLYRRRVRQVSGGSTVTTHRDGPPPGGLSDDPGEH